jgi:hypothetical protein
MGEEFYCILKLISGEEIMALISIDESNDESIIIAQNPVVMKSFNNHQGTFIKIKPWMELSDDDFFLIKEDKIITLTETKNKKLIEMYNQYLSDDSIEVYKPAGQVNLSNEMGYISNVEDARKKLESLYKDLKEN